MTDFVNFVVDSNRAWLIHPNLARANYQEWDGSMEAYAGVAAVLETGIMLRFENSVHSVEHYWQRRDCLSW